MLKLERNILLATTALLCVLGLFFVFDVPSATTAGRIFADGKSQLFGLLIGIVGLIITSTTNVKLYLNHPYLIYAFAIILLLLCILPINLPPLLKSGSANPASASTSTYRWISVFGISFQVSEIVKFLLVIFFAHLLIKRQQLSLFLFYLILPVALMVWQKDLGTLLVMLATYGGMYFLSGAPLKSLGILMTAGIIITIPLVLLFSYRLSRIDAWLHPDSNLSESGYHVRQMKIAIGRGGLIGQGISQSKQKTSNIPSVNTDSIFAIIAEEVGFVGVSAIFLLFMFFLYLIWRIIQYGQLTSQEQMLGYGIWLLFLVQIFVNTAAISGLIPLTGLTLPFFSSGGSSLLVSLLMVGVIINLSYQQPTIKTRKRRYV